MNATKIVKTRDAATSVLRKLGIAKADYNKFISNSNETFAVDVAGAVEHLKPKTKSSGKPTCASTAREMIRSGMNNKEIWAQIKVLFNLDDNKKHYPAWYRCEMRRAGETV